MDQQTLKITGVLSDPTRFSIYQFINTNHREVTVQEIAERFSIHPNVARLHLTKLEDVQMLYSETKKTGRGGRPSRYYFLSNEVISLQFPFRDYQTLSEILIHTLSELGEAGEKALLKSGAKFGSESANSYLNLFHLDLDALDNNKKVNCIETIMKNQGFSPDIQFKEESSEIIFKLFNCSFKEVAPTNSSVCLMHHEFIKALFRTFFPHSEIIQKENMLEGCASSCTYQTLLLN